MVSKGPLLEHSDGLRRKGYSVGVWLRSKKGCGFKFLCEIVWVDLVAFWDLEQFDRVELLHVLLQVEQPFSKILFGAHFEEKAVRLNESQRFGKNLPR